MCVRMRVRVRGRARAPVFASVITNVFAGGFGCVCLCEYVCVRLHAGISIRIM